MTSSDASQTTPVPITVARGDGIGPEIMAAVLQVLQAADARIAPEVDERLAELIPDVIRRNLG